MVDWQSCLKRFLMRCCLQFLKKAHVIPWVSCCEIISTHGRLVPFLHVENPFCRSSSIPGGSHQYWLICCLVMAGYHAGGVSRWQACSSRAASIPEEERPCADLPLGLHRAGGVHRGSGTCSVICPVHGGRTLFGSKLLPIAQRLESICLRIVNTAINSMSYAVCVLIFSGTLQLDDFDDVMFIRPQL